VGAHNQTVVGLVEHHGENALHALQRPMYDLFRLAILIWFSKLIAWDFRFGSLAIGSFVSASLSATNFLADHPLASPAGCSILF
jgi:hypothetical protein